MSYKFDSIVNRKEADALREMIFRRVKERSQSMNEDFQSDVMDMARDSFVSANNPFSKIAEKNSSEGTERARESRTDEIVAQDVQEEGVGFPIRVPKSRISMQSEIINEQMASAAVAATMQEARTALSNKQSFMGALNFLNSQAAISLIKTRADKFEMLA